MRLLSTLQKVALATGAVGLGLIFAGHSQAETLRLAHNHMDGTLAQGTETDGAAPTDTPTEGTETDGTETDSTTPTDAPTEGTETDGTTPTDTPTEGTEIDGTETEGTETDGTAPVGSPTEGVETDGTAPTGNTTEGQSTTGNQPTSTMTIAEVASNSESFSTLVQAAQAAGLAETLSAQGPFTVFAPTDEAFNQLPEGALTYLLQPENQELLAEVLSYHVVPGEITASELSPGAINTLNGGIAVGFYQNRVVVNNASVVTPDIQASNGVIHGINRVLIPEDLQQQLAAQLGVEEIY